MRQVAKRIFRLHEHSHDTNRGAIKQLWNFVDHGTQVRAVVPARHVDFATPAWVVAGPIGESIAETPEIGLLKADPTPVEINQSDSQLCIVKTKNNVQNFSISCLPSTFTWPDAHAVTPINIINLEMELYAHPDRSKVDFVLNGFRYGFYLGFQPGRTKLKSATANCPCAYEHPEIIDEYLAK